MTNIGENNAHIPTSEIYQDIRDTEKEIATLREEADFLEKTPLSMDEAKMNHFKATAKRTGIEERNKFIEHLKEILVYRGLCPDHEDGHHFIPCDEWPATCTCGKQEYE